MNSETSPISPISPTLRTGGGRRRTLRRAALAAAATTAALLLAGCGGATTGADGGGSHGGHGATTSAAPSSAGASEAAADHSAADVAFARDMVVHHEGALTMASDATQRAATPEVRALAERIVAAQQPEIDLMEGWLAAWGEDAGGGDHGGHGSMGMDAMDPAALEAATGTAYDRAFLEQMTVHHEGAVEMARQELSEGTSPEAKALAQRIEADQTAEIAEMAALLAQLPA